ncbi:MAG: hypothetical protein HWE34_09675 [Methylocystaceae bacterium]|nr:hypothetical protein [Methylocystaceae bacterium]
MNRSTFNGSVIFGLIPLLSPVSLLAYVVFFLYIIIYLNKKNIIALSIALLVFVLFFIGRSNLLTNFSSEFFNALNWTMAFSLLMLSPFYRMKLLLSPSVVTDSLLIVYLSMCMVFAILGIPFEALLQISTFALILYLVTSTTWKRRLFLIFPIIISGARTLWGGALYSLAAVNFPKLHRFSSIFLVALLSLLILSGLLTDMISLLLSTLMDNQIYLKGRTIYWASMAEFANTLFGHGIGTSLIVLKEKMEVMRLPHNDWLRIYVDLGGIPLLLVASALIFNSFRGEIQMVASILLGFYMLMGNPLSFPQVMVVYLLVLDAQIVGKK